MLWSYLVKRCCSSSASSSSKEGLFEFRATSSLAVRVGCFERSRDDTELTSSRHRSMHTESIEFQIDLIVREFLFQRALLFGRLIEQTTFTFEQLFVVR